MKGVWNLPNTITISRFFLCCILFVFLALLPSRSAGLLGEEALYGIHIWIIIVLFVVAAVTDLLDGYLARKFGEETRFGRVADPFVDKILTCGCMLFLCSRPAPDTAQYLAPWMVVIMLGREFLVSAIRSLAEAEGIAFPSDLLGKYKFFVQCLAIGWMFGNLADFTITPPWAIHTFVWSAMALTIVSGITYIKKASKVFNG